MDSISRVPDDFIGVVAEPASILNELWRHVLRFEALSSVEPFPNFLDGLFPHYVQAMQQEGFFLSDLE
eukprot:924101-Pyramimonas_sp.AAC.1